MYRRKHISCVQLSYWTEFVFITPLLFFQTLLILFTVLIFLSFLFTQYTQVKIIDNISLNPIDIFNWIFDENPLQETIEMNLYKFSEICSDIQDTTQSLCIDMTYNKYTNFLLSIPIQNISFVCIFIFLCEKVNIPDTKLYCYTASLAWWVAAYKIKIWSSYIQFETTIQSYNITKKVETLNL